MTKFKSCAGTFAALALTVIAAGATLAEDDVLNPLAAQLRLQGYACDHPQSATFDKDASKPDEMVWTVKCEGANYRMRLIPDIAAHIEKLAN